MKERHLFWDVVEGAAVLLGILTLCFLLGFFWG
jgi:hypothetical protein